MVDFTKHYGEQEYKFVGSGPHVFEITVAVPDLPKAMETVEKQYGWVPYSTMPPVEDYETTRSYPLPHHVFKGKEVKGTNALAYYKAGPIRFEFTEGTDGESIYGEFAKRHNAMRIQHVGCRVSNLEAELAALKERGINVQATLCGHEYPFSIAYLDTEELFGFHFELVEANGPMPGTTPNDPVPETSRDYQFVNSGPHVFEITVAVPDIIKAMETVDKVFGWKPYMTLPPAEDYSTTRDYPLPYHYIRGRQVDGTQALAYYKAGPIRFEFMEPTKGESVYGEFVKKRNVMRIQHIGCRVANVDAELTRLKARGNNLEASIAGFEYPFGIAYLDSEELFGYHWELVETDGKKLPGE